jgi:hypothetical protein
MKRGLMMILASAAIASSLLAPDVQARGGGGGGGHMGGFGGAHIGAHVAGARIAGIGGRRTIGFGAVRIVLAQVTWRASTVERASTNLAMERAFTEAPFQFQQRLRLDKLRHPTATPEVMRPRQHLPKSQIRRSEARCQGRLRLEAYT